MAAVVARGEAEVGFRQVLRANSCPGRRFRRHGAVRHSTSDLIRRRAAEKFTATRLSSCATSFPVLRGGGRRHHESWTEAAGGPLNFLFGHDLVRKPVSTLRDHALTPRRKRGVGHDRRKVRGVRALRPPHLHDPEPFRMRAVFALDREQGAVARLVLFEVDVRHVLGEVQQHRFEHHHRAQMARAAVGELFEGQRDHETESSSIGRPSARSTELSLVHFSPTRLMSGL